MINKIKTLFFILLCLGLAGGTTNVFAQTGDKILVAGKKSLKQSDVSKLIDFYEWAFETKFSGEQREKFEDYTIAEFRSDAMGSRATIDDIIGTLPKILAADESVQRETRKNFLEAFLPEARKNSDENSRMLIAIYEAAHNGNDYGSQKETTASSNSGNYEDAAEAEGASNANVGNLSALVGEWVWGRSGSSTYTTGGAYMGSNGSRHAYKFYANGTVEYTGIMNVMTGGCKMQIFKSAKGKARLSGNTLTINWSPAVFTRDDSCSSSQNYKKTLPAETETFQIQFKNSYGQKQLCMTGKDETCFSPAE